MVGRRDCYDLLRYVTVNLYSPFRLPVGHQALLPDALCIGPNQRSGSAKTVCFYWQTFDRRVAGSTTWGTSGSGGLMRSPSANQRRVWRTGRNLARAKQYTVPTASCHDWRSTEKYRCFVPQYQRTVFRKLAFLAHGVEDAPGLVET